MDKQRCYLYLRSWLLAWTLAWGSSLCLADGLSAMLPRGMGALWGGISLVFTAALAKSGAALLLIPGILALLAVGNLLFPLGLPGCLTALGACRTVCRGKGIWCTALIALAPLGLCLFRPGILPGREGLFLLLTGAGVLILSAHTRFQQPRQGNRLAAAAAPLLAAVLGTLLLLNPPESYVNRSAELRNFLSQALPGVVGEAARETALAAITVAPEQVMLREHPRVPSAQPVMTVTAQDSGKLYLRERSYDCYDGSTWTPGTEAEEPFCAPAGRSREVTIYTRGCRQHLFVGYYPRDGVTLIGGAVPNSDGLSQYTLHCSTLVHSPVTEEFPVTGDFSRYLALPEATRLGTEAVLETLLSWERSASEKARSIGAYLRRGKYTLHPEAVPEEGEDFVVSFLEGEMEGSCTHFASAAAVLLRSAGIPARLVAGYLVETEAETQVTVTERDAHAWAEFYEPGLDAWLILEATPPQTSPVQAFAPHETASAEAEKPTLLLPGVFLGITAAELQFWVRRLIRWLRHRRSDPNRRALSFWKEAQTLSRLLKQPVSGELAALSRKACFSPHQLTQGELSVFEDHLRQLRSRLKKKFFLWHLVYRWIYGVY